MDVQIKTDCCTYINNIYYNIIWLYKTVFPTGPSAAAEALGFNDAVPDIAQYIEQSSKYFQDGSEKVSDGCTLDTIIVAARNQIKAGADKLIEFFVNIINAMRQTRWNKPDEEPYTFFLNMRLIIMTLILEILLLNNSIFTNSIEMLFAKSHSINKLEPLLNKIDSTISTRTRKKQISNFRKNIKTYTNEFTTFNEIQTARMNKFIMKQSFTNSIIPILPELPSGSTALEQAFATAPGLNNFVFSISHQAPEFAYRQEVMLEKTVAPRQVE